MKFKTLLAAGLLLSFTTAFASEVIVYQDSGFNDSWKERAVALGGVVDSIVTPGAPTAAELQAIADSSDGGAASAGTFALAPNGVTVTCNGTTPGEVGNVNGVTYTAVTNTDLQAAIGSTDPVFYETACTSLVTDMNVSNDVNGGGVFSNSTLNPDINHWDTSHVTDMEGVFRLDKVFNKPLGNWDTSNVTNMYRVFAGASAFNQLLPWDTSKVTNMQGLFASALSFNQPLHWNTSRVTNMRGVFANNGVFNQPLNWDTSSVTDMTYLFYYSGAFNQDISGWCVPSIGSKSTGFDMRAGFEYNTTLQPQWGTCPP